MKKENVTVGVGPAPAKFEGYKYINNIVYTDWNIRSHQQLTELQILYRNNEVSEAVNVWMERYSLIYELFYRSDGDRKTLKLRTVMKSEKASGSK